MARAAKSVFNNRNGSKSRDDEAVRTVLAIAGAMFSLLGFGLAAGGYLSPNGTAFHIFAGLMLIVSGALVARRHRAGAWIYIFAFAGTVCWSLRNVEFGSSLPQRLVGPSLMIAMIALLMPPLCRWRPRQAVTAFTLMMTATVTLGISSLSNGPLAQQTATITWFLDASTKGVLQ